MTSLASNNLNRHNEIDYYIVCHDENIILDQIKNNKYKNLPNYKFLFVGYRSHNLIAEYDNVIICKNLNNNIEHYPNLCSYTAWYAIVKNKLSDKKYICILEYDVEIEQNLNETNKKHINDNTYIYGYFQEPIQNLEFSKSTPWLDIYIIQNFDLSNISAFIKKYGINYDFWFPTSNYLIENNTLSKFVDWFFHKSQLFRTDDLGAYMHERMVTIYAILNKQNIIYIDNILKHNKLNSHKIKDIYEKYQNNIQQINHEYELCLRQLAWNIPVIEDFDEKFYYDTYADIRNWYLEVKEKTLREKLFHHYFLYGKAENRSRNIEQKNNCINLDIDAKHADYIPHQTPNLSINSYIDANYLLNYTNQLECISLLVTGHEVQDNQYANFLQSLQTTIDKNPINAHFAKLLDFNIFCTQHNYHLIDLTLLSSLFKKVNIIDIDIPNAYNFYNQINEDSDLTYGYKSGPNYSFFQTFKFLTIYNTTLFLECDCYLTHDWLERIYNYTRFSGSFWISGPTYDGYNEAEYGDIVNQHINGGACLYATGCPTFNRFIDFCFDLLPSYIRNVANNMPYDYVIYQIIKDYFNFDDVHKILWQFIKRQYVKNNLIYNYSTNSTHDTRKKILDIIQQYNPAIIHKKLITVSPITIDDCVNPPENFDSIFYMTEYPSVQNYYVSDNGSTDYTDKQRAYHHYLLYGQNLGFFPNLSAKSSKNKNKNKYRKYTTKILRGY